MAATGMSDFAIKPLQKAMKLASMAIQLDTRNNHKEAYCEYLRSMGYVCHVLLEDASNKQTEMAPLEVDKMLQLAEHCLERVKSFAGKKAESSATPTPTSSFTPPACPSPASNASMEMTVPVAMPPGVLNSPCRHRRVLSDGGSSASSFLPPEMFQKMQTVESQNTKKELTPIEEASRLNQKLKANYEVRLSRLAPSQATQKTSLTLSLQRQMMENLIIAKARQDALQRKMEERRLRLQEEANRRFVTSGTVSAEEQEQRVLYASILEYEQDHEWPKVWKANVKKKPYDSALVSGLMSYLLSCPDHPIMKLLKKVQYRIYDKLYPIVSQCPPPGSLLPVRTSVSVQNLHSESSASFHSVPPQPEARLAHGMSATLTQSHDHGANREEGAPLSERDNSFEDLEQFMMQMDLSPKHECRPRVELFLQDLEQQALRKHLTAIVKDVHNAIDRLLSLCLLSFECLNTAAAKDRCVASIEEAFFQPLWSPLLALFRKVYRNRELSFEMSTRLYRNASPDEVGVAPKLFPKDSQPRHGSYPYESAVQELRLLCKDCCPQRKLECIVRTLRLICACAEEYRSLCEPDSPPSPAAIGADDLLPILSYVALRTEMPQLVSECAALEEFIHEGYLIGEEGYCLTSLQSALSYVESMHLGGSRRVGSTST